MNDKRDVADSMLPALGLAAALFLLPGCCRVRCAVKQDTVPRAYCRPSMCSAYEAASQGTDRPLSA